jgi:hypothetical protein
MAGPALPKKRVNGPSSSHYGILTIIQTSPIRQSQAGGKKDPSRIPSGRDRAIHRIPFGPNRGRLIYCSITISPRMYFGVDEQWVALLAREYVKPGDVVYDVGAHVGYTTLLFAAHAGHVHAFELVPSVADEFLA